MIIVDRADHMLRIGGDAFSDDVINALLLDVRIMVMYHILVPMVHDHDG